MKGREFAGKQHEFDKVLRILSRKRDCYVDPRKQQVIVLTSKITDKNGDVIDNPYRSHDLGKGSWGLIDYLVKAKGFRVQKIGKFGGS